MTPAELLRELEGVPHDARMRRMVEVGRRAREEPGVAAVLADLERGGFYERSLALQSCFGSRDGAHVLRALADPSRLLRGLAITLVPVVCDDAQAQAALETASPGSRLALLRRLYKRKRTTPVDRFLDTLAGGGDESLVSLFSFGSAEAAARHLEAVLDRAGYHDWRRLTRHHPDAAASALERRATAAEGRDQRLVWQANAVLPLLAESRPERALALLPLLLSLAPREQLDLDRLARRRPAAVADLILSSDDRARVCFDPVAHRLDTGRLLELVERHGATVSNLSTWFPRLTPERRAALYAACEYGWRDADGCLAQWLVALLPRELREREGRRHLALPALAARPAQRLPYAAFLPWDEARAVLDPSIRDPDAELRAAALGALIDAVRYHRDRLPDLLGLVRARRNEQDPVRGAMLAGLAGLPPGMWRVEHLDDLGTIIREALDAADLSYTTAGAAERLIVALLPFHPAWSADWLATLVRERGQVSLCGLEDRLSDRDVERIAPALLPVLQSWETREREGHLLSAAASLGRRLRVFPELVDILERVLKETRRSWSAEQALEIIAEHRRERIHTLVPSLVREDPSWVTRPVVYTHLHRRRQDLLTPFLGQQAYRGRFSTGKTRFVLPLMNGFERWTSSQQEIFARTLAGVAGDSVRDTPAVLTTILQLAAMPAIPPARLVQLAGDRRPAVRDAALRALGRLDAGQGAPALLEALADDRARIAIYALRGSLLDMPAERALALLRGVSLDRITVAKEVVRLLGDLRLEEAYRDLLALDDRDLHRDVRVALLRALWNHLEREETWPILERAAQLPDPALAAIVGRTPADRLSAAGQRRLTLLIATLLGHPEPRVRLSVLARCVQLPVADPEQALLPRLLEGMGSTQPDESAAAARAVFTTYTAQDSHVAGRAVGTLLHNRRALQTTVHTLQSSLAWSREHLLPAARAVLQAMAADPLTASLRVELAAHALPWEELAELLAEMARSGELHAEALMTAAQAIHTAASRTDAVRLTSLDLEFFSSEDERLRRLGLAALAALAGPPRGWNDERLARLEAYRADSSPLVAAAAQFTLPPVENDRQQASGSAEGGETGALS
jgi:hypothetical protein